ncbi:hypothetical protein FHX74_002024 [Friedmanniella endophytica]|uniref:Uncharacterized protein n=1 Tax=Microlunatus kandeliicorticis TaxID=1759536 RepID=A0A7W3ISH1_9ACTN|nr:hypothetical protein [Microlunatus kandeliicorticis]MBA8794405.1 hypothetical protein [Microlunatus kandeliicorticis]
MSWTWSAEPDDGSVDLAGLGLDQQFPSQGEAESWLGEFYPGLMDAGVRAVSLFEADRKVYGPMPLEPEIT